MHYVSFKNRVENGFIQFHHLINELFLAYR
jgi:hypothetical protein